MRTLITFVAAAALAAPAVAQPAPRHTRTAHPHVQLHPSAETPLDHGPFTPEANRAYQGGGVILQGAPGAPAPVPVPTLPGQVPRNSVPPR